MTRDLHGFRLVGIVVAICCTSAYSHASVFLPPGVLPGDEYHLAFITEGVRDATSSVIEDYNDFVRSEAIRGGSVTENFGVEWFVVGSTASVHARNNAVVQAPVFLLNGVKVADGFDDLWDTSIDSGIEIDQFGAFHDRQLVFTGSQGPGLVLPGFGLGESIVGIGNTGNPSVRWVQDGGFGQTNRLQFYAISEALVAPTLSTVPEATSLAVWLGTIGVVASASIRRRRS